jgi:hypothetical protein
MSKKRLVTALAAILVVSLTWTIRAASKPDQSVRLHPKNPHYFLFRGKAVAFITSGEHYGAVLNADFDFQRYLNAIKNDGLNFTRLFGGSYVEVPAKSFGILRNDLAPAPGRFIAPWARSESAGYSGGGNKFDLDRWNPEYFQRFHDFLAAASERGIVVEISLFSSHYGETQWAYSPFHPGNNVNSIELADWKKLHTLDNSKILGYQERYARKLVHEANAFDNVIYEIQNEPWSDRPSPAGVIGPVNQLLQPPARDNFPNAAEFADDTSLAWQAKVAEWIASEESSLPNKHLVAQNYTNFRLPIRELVPGVSIVNFHYAYPEAVIWNYGLEKAISYDETGFMGRDDNLYRRHGWNFMLSGGSIFDALDYSFSPGHEDGSDNEPNGPGGGSTGLRRQLRVLSEFLQSFALEDLHPDFQTVRHASGTVPRALANPGREYAIYFDGNGPTKALLDLPAGSYSAEWINVRTGAIDRSEKIESKGAVTQLESFEFTNGIALRLKRSPF